MRFTDDDWMLMMLYSPGTRTGLIEELQKMQKSLTGRDRNPVSYTHLRKQIDRIETDHPGYDEYRYNLAEIGHNPYELASLLTVEFENYTRSQVQARLQSIFEAQYELKLEEKVEIRTRKETRVGYRYNPITGTGHTYTYQVTVQYEYKILNVTPVSYTHLFPQVANGIGARLTMRYISTIRPYTMTKTVSYTHLKGQQEHTLILALQFLQQCLCVLAVSCQI